MLLKEYNNNCSSLLLFFNGWGMDINVISHLKLDNYDLMVISDYRDFDFENFDIPQQYTQITVIAWSMGVWVANRLFYKFGDKISKSIAINGSYAPLDKDLGIPRANFQATYDMFSPQVSDKFDLRACGGKKIFDIFNTQKPNRLIEDRKEELKYFLDNATNDKPSYWDKIIISKQDKIFPYENLLNAWKDKPQVIIDAPHYPFYLWNNWDEIIELQ